MFFGLSDVDMFKIKRINLSLDHNKFYFFSQLVDKEHILFNTSGLHGNDIIATVQFFHLNHNLVLVESCFVTQERNMDSVAILTLKGRLVKCDDWVIFE